MSKKAKIFIFKPDGIGDFILATGAIHKLADTYGEENLMICVRSLVAPLAKAQFPQADILELDLLDTRRVLNLFAANFLRSLKPWARLLGNSFECAVSFRHMREYLHTFLFFSACAKRHVVCENLLLRNRQKTRHAVENGITRLRGVTIVAYPAEGSCIPLELEAHRKILAEVLKKEVSIGEIQPRLSANPSIGDYWLCCPFSTLRAKDYPLSKWTEIMRGIPVDERPRQILLGGSGGQVPLLEEFAKGLRAEGFADVVIEAGKGLQDFVNCVAGAKLVLTIDTAAAHIATALDRRTIIIYSGLHRGMFAPWQRSERQIWVEPPPPVRTGSKWHLDITPAQVSAQIPPLLRKA